MASTRGPYELGCGHRAVRVAASPVVITDRDSGFVVVGGRRRERGAVGSLLMFEPGVPDSVDERHVTLEARDCASGVASAARSARAKSTLSSSSATAPTTIPKRNTVPVDPVG